MDDELFAFAYGDITGYSLRFAAAKHLTLLTEEQVINCGVASPTVSYLLKHTPSSRASGVTQNLRDAIGLPFSPSGFGRIII